MFEGDKPALFNDSKENIGFVVVSYAITDLERRHEHTYNSTITTFTRIITSNIPPSPLHHHHHHYHHHHHHYYQHHHQHHHTTTIISTIIISTITLPPPSSSPPLAITSANTMSEVGGE
jgi:hypothetical protein